MALRKTNLRPALTSFHGRGGDLARLAELVTESSLCTILGPAGAGKTRTALRYGELHLDDFGEGGVWFCDLTEASRIDGVLAAVSRALDVLLPSADDAGAVRQLGESIAGRGRILLLLDNCEQVVDAVARVVGAWQAMAASAKFVITSRERLHIEGERTYELPPLELPAHEADPSQSDAVCLFLDRAQIARGGTPLDARDTELVAKAVRALDGLPLAIELAAARMGLMGVATLLERLLERLPQRLDLLAAGPRHSTDRQRTMRGAIDWSWRLLSPWEQAALAQCSVFRGGFSLDAAEAVIDLRSFADPPKTIDVVQALREKSLVRAYEVPELGAELRLGLYDSIRDYATEKLGAVEGDALSAIDRHAEHYLSIGTAWAEGVARHGGIDRLARLGLESANLLAVHERALSRGDAGIDSARRAMMAMVPVLSLRGPFDRYLSLLDATLSRGIDGRLSFARACARQVHGLLDEARADFSVALAEATKTGDRHLEARVLGRLTWPEMRNAESESDLREEIERTIAIHRAVGDHEYEAMAQSRMAGLFLDREQQGEARARYLEALSIARESGFARYEARLLGSLAAVVHKEGELHEARARYEEALLLLAEVSDSLGSGLVQGNLGLLLQETGDLEGARERFYLSRQCFQLVGERRYLAFVQEHLAGLAFEQQSYVDARSLYRDAVDSLRAAGRTREVALALAALGAVHASLDNPTEAAVALDAAEAEVQQLDSDVCLAVIGLHLGHLDLANSRAQARAGDEKGGADHRRLAEARLASAELQPARSDEVRFAIRVLARVVQELPPLETESIPSSGALVVHEDGRWFRIGDGAKVDLESHRSLRLILLELVRRQAQAPGERVPLEDLQRCGWPGERLLPRSGATRVYTAITTLRNMGLRDVLVNRRGGYLLEGSTRLTRDRG